MSALFVPVTLTTDFGTSDHYVAQMKGVILGLAPAAPIVDVSHAIPPQDIRRAAYLVGDLAGAFPAGTVHVAVVDPGVGSKRTILAVAADGQFYVAPDNGLLTIVLERHPDAVVVTVTNLQRHREIISETFHGRDVMAPAAAHLASGGAISDLGPPPAKPPVRLAGLTATIIDGRIEGSVAWADRFGNLITNVPVSLLDDRARDRLKVLLGDHKLVGLRRYYAEVPAGEPLLLLGSSGRLEIAVNGGSAAERFNATAGNRLVVETPADDE